jgi:hypothetical protein
MDKKNAEIKIKENDVIIEGVYRHFKSHNNYVLRSIDSDDNCLFINISNTQDFFYCKKQYMFEDVRPGASQDYSTIQDQKLKFIGVVLKN